MKHFGEAYKMAMDLDLMEFRVFCFSFWDFPLFLSFGGFLAESLNCFFQFGCIG